MRWLGLVFFIVLHVVGIVGTTLHIYFRGIGHPLGGFIVVVCLRIVVVLDSTFFVNSFAHTFGTRPFAAQHPGHTGGPSNNPSAWRSNAAAIASMASRLKALVRKAKPR